MRSQADGVCEGDGKNRGEEIAEWLLLRLQIGAATFVGLAYLGVRVISVLSLCGEIDSTNSIDRKCHSLGDSMFRILLRRVGFFLSWWGM